MLPEDFVSKYVPYAFQAQSETGIDYRVILAQWSVETGMGENNLSKNHNNPGSIKYTGRYGARGPNGFASYGSLDEFVQDYVRVMNLGYYKRVREALGADEQLRQLQLSPYDEGHYQALPGVYYKHFASVV